MFHDPFLCLKIYAHLKKVAKSKLLCMCKTSKKHRNEYNLINNASILYKNKRKFENDFTSFCSMCPFNF